MSNRSCIQENIVLGAIYFCSAAKCLIIAFIFSSVGKLLALLDANASKIDFQGVVRGDVRDGGKIISPSIKCIVFFRYHAKEKVWKRISPKGYLR